MIVQNSNNFNKDAISSTTEQIKGSDKPDEFIESLINLDTVSNLITDVTQQICKNRN